MYRDVYFILLLFYFIFWKGHWARFLFSIYKYEIFSQKGK